MKRIAKVVAVAGGFLLGSATAVAAGVVMSQTAVASGPTVNEMQHRTVYIQGNKEKVDADDVQTITDLDKRLLYVIDKAHKNYVEMPLAMAEDPVPESGGGDEDGGEKIVLERTGGKQVIADQNCDEYRGGKRDGPLEIAVSACVSDSAPGAREIARFDREMVAQIGHLKPTPSGKDSAGVVLEKKSVVNLRLPDPAPHRYRTASLTTKTTVDSIKSARLADQTFTPPKGFSKIQQQPSGREFPHNLPDDLESAMLQHPRRGFAAERDWPRGTGFQPGSRAPEFSLEEKPLTITRTERGGDGKVRRGIAAKRFCLQGNTAVNSTDRVAAHQLRQSPRNEAWHANRLVVGGPRVSQIQG